MYSSVIPPSPSSAPSPRRVIHIPGGVIALVIILLCFGFVLACIFVPQWFIAKHVEPTEPPPGNAAQFDPVQSFRAVQGYAGEGAEFASMEARFVRSDGTLNLTADYKPSPTVDYVFYRTVPPPADAPPMGTTRSASSTWQARIEVQLSKPGQRYYVNRQSGGIKATYNYVNKGMKREENSPSLMPVNQSRPSPTCSFRDLWQQAIQQGVPQDGVATISYDGEYRFQQYGNNKLLRFGADCKLLTD